MPRPRKRHSPETFCVVSMADRVYFVKILAAGRIPVSPFFLWTRYRAREGERDAEQGSSLLRGVAGVLLVGLLTSC